MKQLAALLREPTQALLYSPREWNLALSQARRASVMDRLRSTLELAGFADHVPATVSEVFSGSKAYVAYIQQRLRYEIEQLGALIQDATYPVALLKGAAYITTGAAAMPGRGVSDIDILVAYEHLEDLEARLRRNGWQFADGLTTYDEHYYRTLAHEIPPMRHPNFQFELDVHHNLLQPTHRIKTDIARVLEELQPLQKSPFYVLSQADQIIHSATHLTLGDEMRGGIRDLHDIALLVNDYVSRGNAIVDLLQRGREVGLRAPLEDALKACRRHLLSGDMLLDAALETTNSVRDTLIRLMLDEELFYTSGRDGKRHAFNSALVLMRARAQQMPLHLLASHVLRKHLGPTFGQLARF